MNRYFTGTLFVIFCVCMLVAVITLMPVDKEIPVASITYRRPVTELILQTEVNHLRHDNETLQIELDSRLHYIRDLQEQIRALNSVELSEEEFDLVCRIVAAEARGEEYEGQQGVAQVIRDRYLSGYYGQTISEVVTMPYQFAEPWDGDLANYPSIVEAVTTVFDGYSVFEGKAIYFFNPETSNQKSIEILRKGSTYFGVIGRHEFRGSINE